MPGGRPRKPDSVKAAQGTLQPCRSLEKLAATTTPELAPTPPVGLTKEARAAWKIAIEYAPKGLLVATDFTVLERWARNYALYRKLAKAVDHDGTTITVLKADGSTEPKQHPNVKSLVAVQGVLAACERELGFTPASRARVRPAQAEEEEKDDFEDFLEGGEEMPQVEGHRVARRQSGRERESPARPQRSAQVWSFG